MNSNNSGFLGSIPTVTKNLLIINLLVWVAQFLLLKNGIDLSKYLALHHVQAEDFMPHQFFTYMFMHDPHSFSHVFFNMFAVFMFGRTLETVWGPKRFLVYYVLTGIGAAALHLIISNIEIYSLASQLTPELLNKIYLEGNSILQNGMNYQNPIMASVNIILNTPMLGASGAVFGILVAFGVLFPNVELFIIPIPFPIKAKWFVIGYGVLELSLGMANFSGDNVAHFAHLGGLVTGFIILKYWQHKAKKDGRFF